MTTQTSIDVPRSERAKIIEEVFFLRRAEDSGHKILETDVLKLRVSSLERHLAKKGIKSYDFEEVYLLACQIHADRGAKGPFGIDEILMGANALIAKRNLPQPKTPIVKNVRKDCKLCNGTTLRMVDGKIQYELKDGKQVVLRCECYGK